MRTVGLLVVLALASSVQIARAEIGTIVSADGKTVAVPGTYWTNGKLLDYVVVMDLSTGKELKRLGGNVDVQLCSALSPDGKLLALCGVQKQPVGPAAKQVADAMQKSAGDNAFMQGFMEAAAERVTTKDVPFFGWLQTDTGKAVQQVNLGAAQVNLVAFTPDGKTVIAACNDGKIRLFDVASGKLMRTLTGLDEEIMGLSVNADGKRLAARGEYAIKVWDMTTGKIVRSIDSNYRTDVLHFSQAMALSPNGLYVAAGDSEKELAIWSMATGALVRTVKDAKAFAFSPDSTAIATGNEKGNVKVMNIATGQLKKVFKGLSDLPFTDVFSLQFTKDGSKLIASGGEKVTKVLDLTSGNEVAMFTASLSPIRNVAFDRTGETLLTGTDRGEVRLVDPATGATKSLIRTNKEAPKVAWHPNSKVFAVAGSGVITLYDAGTGQPTRSINTNADDMVCFQFSHDGKKLAAGFRSTVVRVWDVQSGAELFKLGSSSAPKQIDVMGLLTGAAATTAEAEQKKAQQAAGEPRHRDSIIEIAFSPDDSTIASASVDSTVRIWDAQTGKFLRTLVGHADQVNGVAFTADGKRLFSADAKGVVKVWDPQTGTNVQTLKSPDGGIASIGVVDNGGTVVTTTLFMDKPNFIRLLDATSGNVKQSIPMGTDYANNIALTPDGKHLAASSVQGLIRVWDLASGKGDTFEPQAKP